MQRQLHGRPRHGGDPFRQLVAAVTLRAVQDYVDPPANLTFREKLTAEMFVISPQGIDLIEEFTGLHPDWIRRRLHNGS